MAKIVELKGSIDEWRAQRFRELSDLCNRAHSINDVLEKNRSVSSKLVSSHLDLGRILIAAELTAWPDRTVSEMLTSGARPHTPLN